MGRILGIDYGSKRTGIAATDVLRIIASPLTTVHTQDLLRFLSEYIGREKVDAIVVGKPVQRDGTPSPVETHITGFIRKFQKEHPQVPVFRMDERYTSKMAQQALIDAGASRKDRMNKGLTDTVSAGIILQSFLESKDYRDAGL